MATGVLDAIGAAVVLLQSRRTSNWRQLSSEKYADACVDGEKENAHAMLLWDVRSDVWH